MTRSRIALAAGVLTVLACAPSSNAAPEGGAAPSAPSAAQAAARCTPSARMAVAGRASAYDSVAVNVAGSRALVCYGRPSARGRTVFGGLVPYDQLWRTGANEPTIIHLPFRAEIAGIEVQPGSYSLYTVPGREQWTVIVNRSTEQWGHESQYTAQVQAQEVGRATVRPERTDAPVETFAIRAAPRGANAAELILEWENTRVRIPVVRD